MADASREAERDGRAAVAGAGANDCAGAACAVEPEKTCCPEVDVTLLGATFVLPAASPPPLVVLRPDVDGGFVRSAEAGASLRATLGDLNPGVDLAVAAGAEAAGVLGCAAAGAGAGAATVNDATAKPPVGRVAETV